MPSSPRRRGKSGARSRPQRRGPTGKKVEAKLGSRTLRQRMVAAVRGTERYHRIYWQRFEVNAPADGHASIGWQTSLDASDFLLDQVSTLWGLLAYRNKVLDPTLQVSGFHNKFLSPFIISLPKLGVLFYTKRIIVMRGHWGLGSPLCIIALNTTCLCFMEMGRVDYGVCLYTGTRVGQIQPGQTHWRRVFCVVIISGQPPSRVRDERV